MTDKESGEHAGLPVFMSQNLIGDILTESRLSVQTFAPDGQCLGANRAWEELWQAQAASLQNYNLLFDPQLEEKNLMPFIRRAFDGEAVELSPIWYEPSLSGLEGRNRWIHEYLQPVRDEQGDVVEVQAVQHDVTELKRAEDALRFLTGVGNALSSTLNDEKILQNITDLSVPYLADACMVDTIKNDGSLQRVAAAPHAKSPHSATPNPSDANNIKDFTDIPTSHLVTVRRVIDSGQSVEWETEVEGTRNAGRDNDCPDRTALAEWNVTSCLCVPLRAGDDVLGAMTFVSGPDRHADDTLRKLLAEELANRAAISLDNARWCRDAQEASMAKDEFLTIAAHELRTPLTSLLGWAHLLMDVRMDNDGREEAAQKIERNAWTLVQLVNDIVDAARISSGRVQLDLHPMRPSLAVEAALITANPAAQAKDVVLDVQIDPETGLVLADANRLQQVIWILLSNAIKFTPTGGRIELRVEGGEDMVRLVVQDNGNGIDPEFLPFIWERWARSSHRLTRQHNGLGLGLANARYLIEMHGGSIHVESAGIGQGSTFIVELPRPSTGKAGHPAEHSVSASNGHTVDFQVMRDAKVLFVGSDESPLTALSEALNPYHPDLKIVKGVDAALECLAEWRPAILIADVAMPGEDGYTLIRRARALSDEQGGTTPAIALTRHNRTLDRLRAVSSGYQYHLAQPIEPEELATAIAGLIEGN